MYSLTSLSANVMTLQQVATMLDFDECWTFPQQWPPLSIIPFPLFLFKMGLAVVLQWRIYWPLLASTCSPFKALTCWPNRYIMSLSPWCGERNSFFVYLEYIMVQRATAGHQRNRFKGVVYRSVFSCICGAEMWWALVHVNVWMLNAVCVGKL